MVGGSMQCPAAVGLRASGFLLAAGQSLRLALRGRLLFPAMWGFSAWLFPPHSQQEGRDSSKTGATILCDIITKSDTRI